MSDPDDDVAARFWRIAASVCTGRELEVLVLREQRGLGSRRIALVLGITRSAVRERLDRADRKIVEAFEREAA